MFKCWFNKKVLVGLGALGLAIFVVAPSVRHYLPVLLSLACPLSMVAMMLAMGMGAKKTPTPSPATDQTGSKTVTPSDHEIRMASLRSRIAELEAEESRSVRR